MKKDIYVRRKWEEEDIIIYLHFIGENAVRQMEVFLDKIIKTSKNNPISEDSYLYDQNFSDIKWDESDFISEDEFNEKWNT